MRLFSLCVVVASISLAGCEITGPSVKIKSPVEVKVKGVVVPQKHCPPGQKKKGYC